MNHYNFFHSCHFIIKLYACVYKTLSIESYDYHNLRAWNKSFNLDQLKRAVHVLLTHVDTTIASSIISIYTYSRHRKLANTLSFSKRLACNHSMAGFSEKDRHCGRKEKLSEKYIGKGRKTFRVLSETYHLDAQKTRALILIRRKCVFFSIESDSFIEIAPNGCKLF